MTTRNRQTVNSGHHAPKYLSRLIAVVAGLMIAACANREAISDTRLVVSEPSAAYVSIRDNRERELFNCLTPCRIKVADSLLVFVSKEGFTAQRFYVAPGRGTIRVQLELTAASEAVDSVELPELN
ncbi:MAG: hypothetical protein AAFR72_12340 [Pseudomonadota bacterium]